MRITRTTDLTPGTPLGDAVRGRGGRVLLNAGLKLTTSYIDRIRALGVGAVYVHDPDTADVVPPQPITHAVREKVVAGMSDAFDAVAKMAEDTRRRSGRTIGQSFGADGHASPALQAASAQALATLVAHGGEMIDQLHCHEVVTGLNSLKCHDTYTFQHSIDVAIVGVVLAKKAGWDKQRVRAFGMGCLLHDIGKVFIDPAILNKNGPLTPAEHETLRAHPLLGYKLIKSTAPALGLLVPQVALQHHERQDGAGYPRGLRGVNRLGRQAGLAAPVNNAAAKPGGRALPRIHEFGALAAVADVYDALTSDRPYRDGYHPARAFDAIYDMSGTHLNAEAVDLLHRCLPPFPVCCEVRVVDGAHAGHTGIVVSVPSNDLRHPRVRVLNDPSGHRLSSPVEIDLAVDRDVRIDAVGRPVSRLDAASGSSSPPAQVPPAAGARRDAALLPPAVEEFLQQFDFGSLEQVA